MISLSAFGMISAMLWCKGIQWCNFLPLAFLHFFLTKVNFSQTPLLSPISKNTALITKCWILSTAGPQGWNARWQCCESGGRGKEAWCPTQSHSNLFSVGTRSWLTSPTQVSQLSPESHCQTVPVKVSSGQSRANSLTHNSKLVCQVSKINLGFPQPIYSNQSKC